MLTGTPPAPRRARRGSPGSAMPGVAGVADQSDFVARRADAATISSARWRFVVVVAGTQRTLDAEVLQQTPGVAGVLGVDEFGLAKRLTHPALGPPSFRSAWRPGSALVSSGPVPRIEEVLVHGAPADLDDHRQLALELAAADQRQDPLHEPGLEAQLEQCAAPLAAIDVEPGRIDLLVAEAQLILVGLALPQVGAGRLVDDSPADPECAARSGAPGSCRGRRWDSPREARVARRACCSRAEVRSCCWCRAPAPPRPCSVVEDASCARGPSCCHGARRSASGWPSK